MPGLIPALSQHYASGGAPPVDAIVQLKSDLGSALKHLWIPQAARVTLGAAARCDAIADNVASGAVSMTRTVGTPTWNASGGPGGREYVTLTSTDALLRADGLGYANGHTISLYALVRYQDDFAIVTPRTGTNTTCYLLAPHAIGGGNYGWRTVAFYSDGSLDEAVAATPAWSVDWHLVHIRALVGGGIRGYVDGELCAPNGVLTKAAKDLSGIHLGYVVAGSSRGDCAGVLLVDAVNDARDLSVRRFAAAYWGFIAS